MHSSTVTQPARRLVLASTSRYRRQLLRRIVVTFEVGAPSYEERPLSGESPRDTALRLSIAKARSVAKAFPDALIIGSDQVADLDGEPIGKPVTHDNGLRQLISMQGRRILFHTGIALYDAARDSCQSDVVDTAVTFRELGAWALERYLQHDEPYDCAGSAKIEGLGIALAKKVESDDPTALIGLPLIRLTDMLLQAGFNVI
jgi:septum formation protein